MKKKITSFIFITLLTLVAAITSLSLDTYAAGNGLTVNVEPECDYKLFITDGGIICDQDKLILGKDYTLHIHKYAESDPYFVVDQIFFENCEKNFGDIFKNDVFEFKFTGTEVITVRGHMEYPDKVKVTFNFNGAVCKYPSLYSGIKDQISIDVPFNSNISLSNYDFEKTGYELSSYIINGDKYSLSSIYGPVKEDTVIDTKWDETIIPGEEVKATFDVLGSKDIISPVVTSKGKTITLPSCNYKNPGYKFTGWECGGVIYKAGDNYIINNDSLFVAMFEENDYINIIVDKTNCADINYEVIFKYSDGKIVDVNNVYKGEKIFASFMNNFNSAKYTDFKVESDVYGIMNDVDVDNSNWSFIASDNVTFKIYMKEKTEFVISFDANGGKGKMDAVKVKAGKDYEAIECDFTKDGYIFDGWTLDDKKVTKIKVTSDITLKATWKRFYESKPIYKSDDINPGTKNQSDISNPVSKISDTKIDIEIPESSNITSKKIVSDDVKLNTSNQISEDRTASYDTKFSAPVINDEPKNISYTSSTKVISDSSNTTMAIGQAEDVAFTPNYTYYEEEKADPFYYILAAGLVTFMFILILTVFMKSDSYPESDLDDLDKKY